MQKTQKVYSLEVDKFQLPNENPIIFLVLKENNAEIWRSSTWDIDDWKKEKFNILAELKSECDKYYLEVNYNGMKNLDLPENWTVESKK